ncbi:hypothetical protein [Streptomyces sp. NPDC053431]|uniref:hypothetical protein n=1 Tax=Streptomyces sp. NPDC053431 TaxID=3365703 RepID=UPI0037D43819
MKKIAAVTLAVAMQGVGILALAPTAQAATTATCQSAPFTIPGTGKMVQASACIERDGDLVRGVARILNTSTGAVNILLAVNVGNHDMEDFGMCFSVNVSPGREGQCVSKWLNTTEPVATMTGINSRIAVVATEV